MSRRESIKKGKPKKTDSTYIKIFKLYDEDKDGFVDFIYLPEMMRSAGAIFLDNDLERPMETIRNNNGADIFTQKDYVDLCLKFTNTDETEDDLIEAFKFWDTDNSGRVSTEEIRRALTTLGDKLSEDEINALIKEADPSNVGAIDYEHYSKILFRQIN